MYINLKDSKRFECLFQVLCLCPDVVIIGIVENANEEELRKRHDGRVFSRMRVTQGSFFQKNFLLDHRSEL